MASEAVSYRKYPPDPPRYWLWIVIILAIALFATFLKML
jgi:hypothetical protein